MNEPDQFNSSSDAGTQPIETTRGVPKQRPIGLTVICVLAIVLGCLGILATIVTGVQLTVGQQLQQSFRSPGAPNQEIEEIQQEMQSKIQDVTRRFFVPHVILQVVKFALCIAMIYAAVRTLNLHASGRRQLAWVFAFLIAFEIVQLTVFVLLQLQMRPIMAEYMPKLMKVPDGANAPPAEFGQLIASATIIFGLIVHAVWSLAKIIYYGVARRYLRKVKIQSLFEPAGT